MKTSFPKNLAAFAFLFSLIIFSCQKKDNSNTPQEIKGSANMSATSSTTGGSTTGGSTTGASTTGGSTTGGSTTGGSTTGGSSNLKGTIVFHKPENCYNTISLYFQGSKKGELGPSARHANPTCNQNGCIIITNLSYGSYSYEGRIYAASGDYLRSEYGSVKVDAPCVAKSVNP